MRAPRCAIPAPARYSVRRSLPRGSGSPCRHGRVASNPGAPVRNPAPTNVGPPFYPFRWPARIRPVLPPCGRTAGSRGGPVLNPVTAPFGQPFLAGHSPGNAAATQVITITTPTQAGDAILIALANSSSAGATVSSITDSAGNTYSRVIPAAGVTSEFGDLWAAFGTTALSAGQSVTVTWSTATGAKMCVAIAVPGVAGPDQAPTVTHGTSTTPSITSGTLLAADELVIGVLNNSLADAPLPTLNGAQGISRVVQAQAGTSPYVTVCYAQTSSTAAVTYSAKIAASATWCAMMVTLQPAAVFPPQTGPARARLPQTWSKGRTASSPGGPVQNPAPVVIGPPFFPLRFPARIRPSLPPRGHIASNAGAPASNPVPGPVFRQSPEPARARIPQVFSKGRASGNPGTAAYSGPVFRQATSPARIHPSLPPRGRIASNPGAPVHNPVPPGTGPAFTPFTSAVRIRPAFPPRGRAASNPGAPVRNPVTGPPVRPLRGPVRAVIPQVFSRGRVSARPGTPPATPAPVYPQHGPVRVRPSLPPRGRIGSNPGIPVVPPVIPAPVYPQHGPARIRPALPRRGRVTSCPGIPVVPPSVPAPVYPQHGPVTARRPLPPRGRIASSPGIPVLVPAPLHPLRFPARIRRALPPRGRIASNPGAPVRNPGTGPKVYPQHGPAGLANRAPGPFRKGSAQVSARSPVGKSTSPYGIRFSLGIPYFRWATGSTATQWRVP